MSTKQKQKLTDLGLTEFDIQVLKVMKKNIYVKITSVSKSGMSRKMQFCTIHKGKIVWCTYLIAQVLKEKMTKHDEIKVDGCGMDMIFHVLTNFNYAFSKILTGKTTGNYSKFWVNANNYGRI